MSRIEEFSFSNADPCVCYLFNSPENHVTISSYGSLYDSLFWAQPFLTLISFFVLVPITDHMAQSHCAAPCCRDMSCSSTCLLLPCAFTWHPSLSLSPPEKPTQSSRSYRDVISSGKPEACLSASSSLIRRGYITTISEPLYFLIYTFIFSSDSTCWLV